MLGNPELERKWLELTYDGIMTVTGSKKETVGSETVVTHNAVLYADQPCALSFSGTPDVSQGEDAGEIGYRATIFCAPELVIPAGAGSRSRNTVKPTSWYTAAKASPTRRTSSCPSPERSGRDGELGEMRFFRV